MKFVSAENAGNPILGGKLTSEHRFQPEHSDEQLLSSISLDETGIFWCLWNRHQEALRKTCLREMDGNVADAEDALSQMMLKTLDSLPKHAPEIKHLKAWLTQMARNLCVDLRRKRRHQSETAENWKVITHTEPKAEQPMQQAERDSEIKQHIAALPPNLRESFELHVVREIPVNQVASRLGLSPANVRKRVQFARARLRRHLEKNPHDRSPAGPLQHRAGSGEVAQALLIPVGEMFPSTAQTVRVKLSCGVEELFHVFASKTTFAPGRKIKSLRNQLAREPDHFENRLQLGNLFYRQGEWHAAVVEWQRALTLQPQVLTALRLGQTLVKLGRLDLAATTLERIQRKNLTSVATAHYIDGWIAYSHRDGARSAAEFQAGANLEPKNAWHWRGLALAQRLAGRTSEAVKAMERALKLNPNDLVALSLGHEIWMANGDIQAAFHHAQQFLKLVPDDILTMRRLVDCRCDFKLTQGAAGLETRQLLRRALRLSKNSLLMNETLAAFLLSQDDLKKALAVYREFTRRHPQCPMGRKVHLNLLARSVQGDHLPVESREIKPSAGKLGGSVCVWHEKAAPFCA